MSWKPRSRALESASKAIDSRHGPPSEEPPSWHHAPVRPPANCGSLCRSRTGNYKMKTVFQGDGKCLEGNRFAATSTLRGAAFMDNCQNVSGQLWKIVDRGNGYFTLTTMFRESSGECLEGNRFAPTSTLEGAAFMSTCRPFTGQLFKAEKFA